MSCSCCSSNKEMILDPAILDQIDACCSSYTWDPDSDDENYILTLDPGDGSGPTVVTWPKPAPPEPCKVIACGVAPDGTVVISTLVDGAVAYTTADGSTWTGDPGGLV